VLADLVRSLRPLIVELGLADERELTEVDQAVRAHLADPRTLVVPHLWFTAWAASRPGDPGRRVSALTSKKAEGPE
jgi:hypothetical protein